MKNEIVLTEEQRTMILAVYSQLSDEEKDLLYICSILTENGVARRDLYNVLRVLEYMSSDFDNKLNRLVDSGLLVDRGDHIIWCPAEIKRCILPTYAIPTNMLDRVTNHLVLKTTPSMYLDALACKPLFTMALGVIDFVVEMRPDNIDWALFASLIYNYAMAWPVFGLFEIGIKGREDTITVRAIRLAKENVNKETTIYCNLLALEVLQFVHAFMYEEAKNLIDEVESKGNQTTPLFILAQGYYWETYGEYSRALFFYSNCYKECLDDYIKPTVCMIISLLTSLIGDVTTSEYWMNRVHTSALPKHHICRFYYNLIQALNAPDDYFAEENFKQAKDCVCDVNMEAPILGRLWACQSHYYSVNEQPKLGADLYSQYCHHTARYGSTSGAYYILIASEISRLVMNGNLLSCKHLLYRLDRVPLKAKEVALSVQIQCCEGYVDYYLAEGNPLCKVYCKIALELLEEKKPDEIIVKTVVNDVFNGHMPLSLLNETSFFFHLMLLKWGIHEVKQVQTGCLSRQNNNYKKVWEYIRELRTQFPDHCLDIDVMAASLVGMKSPGKACKWWRESIKKAIGKEKYRIALTSACYATEIGYIFEAKDMLLPVYNDVSFKMLNKGKRCVLLIELAKAMESCGTRYDAPIIWEQARSESEGTELLPKVYYSQAICAYDREDYKNALNLLEKCLRVYPAELSVHDETLASIQTYCSVCLSQQSRLSEAIASIRSAMEYWPDLYDKSAYNLYYNLAFYCLGAHEWNDAKLALEKIKAMPGLDETQLTQIEDLYEILRIPLERRVLYMRFYFCFGFS